jgi:ABC-type phosphate transport system substrate-binding protein
MVPGIAPAAGDDPYGTVALAGQGSAQSAETLKSLASAYRYVTTAVRNNFATASTDQDALARLSSGDLTYAVIDDLQATALPATDVLAVPMLGAALVLPYNLNSFGSANVSNVKQLVSLDLGTVAKIFDGTITQWYVLGGTAQLTFGSSVRHTRPVG